MEIKYSLTSAQFYKYQFILSTLIILAGLAAYLFTYFTGYGRLLGLIDFFDVGKEQSLPTYFSLMNLFLSSVLLFILFQINNQIPEQNTEITQSNHSKYWLFLSLLFLFLSLDESAGIHENFALLYEYLVEHHTISRQLSSHQWLPFGIAFVVIIFIILIPFIRKLSSKTRTYFLLSGFVFLSGAIGFEYLGAFMLDTGISATREELLYRIRRIFEEGFEIYGIVLFNCALYREINLKKASIKIQFN